VYSSIRSRESIALGVRKGLIGDTFTRHAILGSETEKFDALEPFVSRYEKKLGEINWDPYSFPEKFEPKSDMLPKLQFSGASPFTLKNYDSTVHRHRTQIGKTNKIPYHLVVDKNFKSDVIYKVSHGYGFNSLVEDARERGKLMLSHIRSIRIDVKWATHEAIAKRLEQRSYPKSWATAFYVSYFGKINRLMEEVTQMVVRRYFPKDVWKEHYGEYNKYVGEEY
jgi:hypothetical protein